MNHLFFSMIVSQARRIVKISLSFITGQNSSSFEISSSASLACDSSIITHLLVVFLNSLFNLDIIGFISTDPLTHTRLSYCDISENAFVLSTSTLDLTVSRSLLNILFSSI